MIAFTILQARLYVPCDFQAQVEEGEVHKASNAAVASAPHLVETCSDSSFQSFSERQSARDRTPLSADLFRLHH